MNSKKLIRLILLTIALGVSSTFFFGGDNASIVDKVITAIRGEEKEPDIDISTEDESEESKTSCTIIIE